MAEFGYLRVSYVGQNTVRQFANINLDKTFIDKISRTSCNRPEL